MVIFVTLVAMSCNKPDNGDSENGNGGRKYSNFRSKKSLIGVKNGWIIDSDFNQTVVVHPAISVCQDADKRL
jgi:hypothetical protein